MRKKQDHLSNDELIKALMRACADVNRHVTHVIYLLIDVEERRVHLEEGCSSMFEFCTKRLGMSEGQAFLRITSARLVRTYPMLGERLERGELHMSILAQLRNHLTPENVEQLIEATRGKTKMQVKEMLAAKAPRPVKPSSLRKLPTIRTANDITPVVERHIEPVTESRYRLNLTVTRRQRDVLLYVRDLSMHRNPTGDLTELVMSGVENIRVELEREVFGGSGPRDRPVPRTRPRPPAKTGGRIPRAVRREVFERDGHRCTFESAKGHRCSSTVFLELDHIVPAGKGGTSDADNLRVRCFAHNKLHAEHVYGADYIRRKIDSSQRKSAQRKAGATALAVEGDLIPAPA